MKKSQSWYEDIVTKEWGRYSKGAYAERDRILTSMLKLYSPRRIFEPCGAEGFLARVIVESIPSIEEYIISEFVHYAVERMTKDLADLPKITVKLIDIDEEYTDIDFRRFDLFVCTAFEHLVNDREILQVLPQGIKVALCLPNFGGHSHLRLFKSFEEIEARYGDLIQILERKEVIRGTRRLVIGTRKVHGD